MTPFRVVLLRTPRRSLLQLRRGYEIGRVEILRPYLRIGSTFTSDLPFSQPGIILLLSPPPLLSNNQRDGLLSRRGYEIGRMAAIIRGKAVTITHSLAPSAFAAPGIILLISLPVCRQTAIIWFYFSRRCLCLPLTERNFQQFQRRMYLALLVPVRCLLYIKPCRKSRVLD